MLIQRLLNLFFGYVADDLFFYLSVFEHQQGWYAANPVAHGSGVVAVHVHFADLHFASVFACEFLNYRGNGAARTTPSRPKVHQYWGVGLQDILVKILVCDFNDSCRHASSTSRVRTEYRNTVLDAVERRRTQPPGSHRG